MGRKRSVGKRDLPDNLYSKTVDGVTYFQYKDRRTGQFIGLGTDKAAAIKDANAMNPVIAAQLASWRIESIITETPSRKQTGKGRSVEAYYEDRYSPDMEAQKARGEIGSSTVYNRRSAMNGVINLKGQVLVSEFTGKDAVDIYTHYEEQGKTRMAQSIRSALVDFFRHSIGDGERTDNPILLTRTPKHEVKRQRLLLDEYLAIHDTAVQLAKDGQVPWFLPRGMNLMLTCGQRPGDVVKFMFTDVKPIDGDPCLHVIPSKNKGKVLLQIPTRLRLDAVDLSLADAIADCRDQVLSRYMLHYDRQRGGRIKKGAYTSENTLNRHFVTARNASGLTWDETKGTPPTIYELRSLAKRLYMKQGIDTKTLLGHSTEQMDKLYADGRGREWTKLVL